MVVIRTELGEKVMFAESKGCETLKEISLYLAD
jgi:hypothetical protein